MIGFQGQMSTYETLPLVFVNNEEIPLSLACQTLAAWPKDRAPRAKSLLMYPACQGSFKSEKNIETPFVAFLGRGTVRFMKGSHPTRRHTHKPRSQGCQARPVRWCNQSMLNAYSIFTQLIYTAKVTSATCCTGLWLFLHFLSLQLRIRSNPARLDRTGHAWSEPPKERPRAKPQPHLLIEMDSGCAMPSVLVSTPHDALTVNNHWQQHQQHHYLPPWK